MMNNTSAYGVVQKQTSSGRALEREVLERVNMRLSAADPDTVSGLSSLHEALRLNRNVWMTFATDLASPTNEYPDALKASMISIAAYIEQNTVAAVRDKSIVESFVTINHSIIQGLSGIGTEAVREAG